MKKSTKKSLMSLKTWLKGLASAAIGGAANSAVAIGVSPETFNFGPGLDALIQMAIGGAIISTLMYLKSSPIPKDL